MPAAAFVDRRVKWGSAADLDDVLGGRAFLALDDVELHAVSLGQRLEAVALDRGVMDEAVLLSILQRDETEPLAVIEPLHFSGALHFSLNPLSVVLPRNTKGTHSKNQVPLF